MAAQPQQPGPVVEAPAGCGDSEAMVARLRGLGVEPDAEPAWRARVVIAPQGEGFQLSLDWPGAPQPRRLRDAHCAALFDGAVVILAVAMGVEVAAAVAPPSPPREPPVALAVPAAPTVPVDATRGGPTPTPSPGDGRPVQPDPQGQPAARPAGTPPARAASTESASPPPPTPASPPPPTPPSWGLELGGGFGVLAGVLPEASPAGILQVGLRHGATGLQLEALLPWARQRRLPSGHGVVVGGAGARLLAAYAPHPLVDARAGLSAMRLTGRGVGEAVDPGEGAALRLSAELQLAVRLALGWPSDAWFVEWVAGGAYSGTRPAFEIAGFGGVFRVPRWTGEVGLRLFWRMR